MTQRVIELLCVANRIANAVGVSSFEVKTSAKFTFAFIHFPELSKEKDIFSLVSDFPWIIDVEGYELRLKIWTQNN